MDILIALGGNAILRHDEKGTFEEQQSNISDTARYIIRLIKKGHNVVITHGNGPQVGDILLRYELSKAQLPTMPLHVCGGESQGIMGYMIEQAMANELGRVGIKKDVVCILTRTVVRKDDSHFRNPSKPIGPFYAKNLAEKLKKKYGWTLVREGVKYRRVVPSPTPIEIVELDAIQNLISGGKLVICAGGGGVPVIRKGKSLRGIDAVIDKDLASSLLASKLNIDMLLILTEVDSVFLNYGQKNQKKLTHATVKQCEAYLEENQFEDGTMKPKIQAAVNFVKSTGNTAVITTLKNVDKALDGHAGTVIG